MAELTVHRIQELLLKTAANETLDNEVDYFAVQRGLSDLLSAKDRIAALEAAIQAEREKVAEAMGYLGLMLTTRYPDVQLLPDVIGICTQIDNGFGGALRVTEEKNATLESRLAQIEREFQDMTRRLKARTAALAGLHHEATNREPCHRCEQIEKMIGGDAGGLPVKEG